MSQLSQKLERKKMNVFSSCSSFSIVVFFF